MSEKSVTSTTDTVAKASGTCPLKGFGVVQIVAVVVALILGLLLGRFVLTAFGASGSGKTTLTEAELGTTVATYTQNGRTTAVSAREVLESQGMLTAGQDGTYPAPRHEAIVEFVRNRTLANLAEARGITASDDEVTQMAEDKMQTSDWDQIGQMYGLSGDAARETIRNLVLFSKLRDEVAGALPEMPTAPTQPADGAQDTPTAEYGQYIVGLLGDEWDEANNTWARTDGDYYATLSGYQFTKDSATYAAAQAAYNVAVSQYQTKAMDVQQKWSDFVSEEFAHIDLTTYGIAV